MPRKIRFEDKIEVIDAELNKRRSRWKLQALPHFDFDDVKQKVRIHVAQKWKQWQQHKPLEPWVNRVITNQIINIIRNEYGAFCRPCLKCNANEGDDLCSIYVRQCENCPLFLKWTKTKKRAYNIKIPVHLENHPQTADVTDNAIDYEGDEQKIHICIQKYLNPIQKKIYHLMYMLKLSDKAVAKEMCYTKTNSNPKNLKYKQLENYKKQFIIIARRVIEEENLG